MPLPLNGIIAGMMLAPFAMLRPPAREPAAVGVNVTLALHVPLTARGDDGVQLSVSEKSPVVLRLIIRSGPFPAFVSVSCWGVLDVPTFWLPKLNETAEGAKTWGGTVTGTET